MGVSAQEYEEFRRRVALNAGSQGRGLEHRYDVKKTHDPAGKHDDCRYFVLDPQHDPIARAALAEYATRAEAQGYRPLADDLRAWLAEIKVAEIKVAGRRDRT